MSVNPLLLAGLKREKKFLKANSISYCYTNLISHPLYYSVFGIYMYYAPSTKRKVLEEVMFIFHCG